MGVCSSELVVGVGMAATTAGPNRAPYQRARQMGSQQAVFLRGDLGITIATGVSLWVDQSGSGGSPAQATGSKQPAFSAAGGPNTTPCIVPDGVDDTMNVAIASLVQPEHLILVGKYNLAFAANDDLVDGNGGNRMRVLRGGANQINILAPTGLGGAGFDSLNWHWLTCLFNGVASAVKQDKTTLFSGNAGTNAALGLTIGTFGDGVSDPANCSIAEIRIFRGVLSVQNEARIRSYMAGRYAL